MAAERALDKIHIRDLRVRCTVGLYPEERRDKQDVIINVTLHVDLRKACSSDRIEDTVDYKAVKKRIIALVEESSDCLVERLAERLARLCLDEHRVKRVDVTVDKPGALRFARSVAIEITRKRTRHA
jgi:FolB domain-containing protein